MQNERWQRLWALFHEALEHSGTARKAFLDEACPGDAAMRSEIEELIAGLEESPDFLSGPATMVNSALEEALARDPLLGERVGAYRIRDVIGEGGMGIVYDAEQEVPVRRRVALKLIKLGMDTREVIARFEAERQALALMNHPNIASVLDAGVTDSGRPYFVMEHVAGVPITAYCDDNRLAVESRLELFMAVCSAIQHAHQKGIIHRDVKPSNVLVTMQDGRPVPKVIDFGVAKALNQRLTEKTVYTALGRFIGTPEYMSPEQAESGGLDVDTRTDIYSLGVLLYKLLCGALPLDRRELTTPGYDALRDTLRRIEPRRPSERIGGDAPTVTGQRRSEARALRRRLRGDLDWIVMRALEKDRTRRYQTASELAADLERHLAGEAVLAGPPGALYRLSKFARRHKVGVALSLAVLLLTGIVAAAMTAQSLRLARALAAADLQRERAEQVTTFLVELFRQPDPGVARGRDITVREALDRGAAQLTARLDQQPQLRAALHGTIGEVYMELGDYAEALTNHTAALELLRSQSGPDHPDTARAAFHVGETRMNLGDYTEAGEFFRQALRVQRRSFPDGSPVLAETLNELGYLRMLQGHYEEAESLQREGLAMREGLLGARHEGVADSLNNLAITLRRMNRYAEAERRYRDALDIWREVLGEDSPQVGTLQNNLGVLMHIRGRFDEALGLFEASLANRRLQLGPDHLYTGLTVNNLAGVYIEKGDFVRAEELYREAVAIHTAAIGADKPETLGARANVARAIFEQGDHRRAAQLYRDVLRDRRRVLEAGDPQIGTSQTWLARALVETGDLAEAQHLALEALAIFDAALEPGHWRLALAQSTLARVRTLEGDLEEAERLLHASLPVLEERRGERAQVTLAARRYLADLYERAGRTEQAAAQRRRLAELAPTAGR